jgi:hypothetical protein
MAKHQFILIEGVLYIVCGSCHSPVGRKVGLPGEWAAYDDPGDEVTAAGQPVMCVDWRGQKAQPMVAMDRDRALCAPCYLAAFAKRYPGATPPTTLEDRRLVKKE